MNTKRPDGGNRVVITGMGWISPAGNTLQEGWHNISQGICRITPLRDTFAGAPVHVGGQVLDFDPALYMDKKLIRRTDIFSQFALAAGSMAMADAGYTGPVSDPEDFGAVIGTGAGGIHTTLREHDVLQTKGYKRVNSLLIPTSIANMACAQLSLRYDLRGPCTTENTACATGINAIGNAFRTIKHGYAAAMLCGSTEPSLTPLMLAGFAGLQALSLETDPLRACLPFDLSRSGFVAGEGAGILVLESLDHAQARGAHVYAEVLGYGATADAYHMTAPHPEGRDCARAIRLALREGGIAPEQLDYLNAHGTATPLGDKVEALAIKAALGAAASSVSVSSTKSVTGHLLAAAASVETIACTLALQEGLVPPTAGSTTPDPDCDLDITPLSPRRRDIRYALNNALGFGGHNAALLLGRIQR